MKDTTSSASPTTAWAFPPRGNFRLESHDPDTLTGFYRRDGTAIRFSWSATRE